MRRARRIVSVAVVGVSIMVGPREPAVRAAGSAATVSVVRRPDLTRQVWPGDFNGDGVTDLAGTAPGSAGVVRVLLGNGSGGFPTARDTAYKGHVLGVSDFNGDAKLDLIVMSDPGPGQKISILPGKGDGTFGAAIDITALDIVPIAAGVDMNGDGKRDLVVLNRDGSFVYIYPGNGDFTFGAATNLETLTDPSNMSIADLNGDGRPDLVVTTDIAHSVSIYLNEGSMNFTATDIALDRSANAVVAQDVNGDGRLDLVLAMASPTETVAGPMYRDGFAYVLTGNGNGTFSAPAKYPVAPGAYEIAVGDFNRDGIPDIATANRSTILYDDCTDPRKTWDSLSVLPGVGNGTFAPHSSFSIGNQQNLTDMRYRNTVTSLQTADLNGDRQADLIVSQGVLFLNQPTDPNWPPKVTASSTTPAGPGDHSIVLSATASDVDQDMLTYSWSDSAGTPIPPVPYYCFSPGTLGVHTFTVTVSDRDGNTATSSVTVDFGSSGGTPPSIAITAPRGGEVVPAAVPYTIRWTATPGSAPIDEINVEYSTDDGAHYAFVPGCSHLPATATSCVWNDPDPPTQTARIFISAIVSGGPFGDATTAPFTIRANGGGGSLPSGWTSRDIGAVSAAGSATYSNGAFTVKGDGADIWGTADAFQYVYTVVGGSATGDFDLTTHVTSVQNVDPWTKAGLMVRESVDAAAAQASVFVSPGKGVAFQRRTTNGGASVNTSVASVTAPVWLRLRVQSHNVVVAMYKKNATDAWTVLGIQQFPATSSGYTFDDAGLAVTSHHDGTLAAATFSNVDLARERGWQTTVIGTTFSATVVATPSGALTVNARGADIWGTADQFTYAYQSTSGDGEASANVRSVSPTNAWTKAGVMYRASLDPGAPHVSLFVTPGKGIALQYRAGANGVSTQFAQVAGTAPVYLRLRRTGSLFVGEWTTDLQTWHEVGEVIVEAIPASAVAGVALTSHDASATATAVFEDATIQ